MSAVITQISCDSKQRFPTWQAANRVAEKNMEGKDRAPLKVYRCRHCHGFHLSNIEGKGPEKS